MQEVRQIASGSISPYDATDGEGDKGRLPFVALRAILFTESSRFVSGGTSFIGACYPFLR